MLVLSRKRSERIMIGRDVVITVVDIMGDEVRIGIDAPGIPVHREEVFLQVMRENPPGDDTLGVPKYDDPK